MSSSSWRSSLRSWPSSCERLIVSRPIGPSSVWAVFGVGLLRTFPAPLGGACPGGQPRCSGARHDQGGPSMTAPGRSADSDGEAGVIGLPGRLDESAGRWRCCQLFMRGST